MVKHAIKLLFWHSRVTHPLLCFHNETGHILINKLTGGCIINQIKEVNIQIICFYYDDAVGNIGCLKKIPQRILKHLGNFGFVGFFFIHSGCRAKPSLCLHSKMGNLKLSASDGGTGLYNQPPPTENTKPKKQF